MAASTSLIWSGAKWCIAPMTTIVSPWTTKAVGSMLGTWLTDGLISFTDNPALSNLNEFSEFFGAMSASVFGYLFSKTFFPSKIFPSLIIFTTVESILLPPFYHYFSDNLKVILNWHAPNVGTDWVEYAATFYITLISAWVSELSKIPLI